MPIEFAYSRRGPSYIKEIYDVTTPKPRDVTSDEFVALEREILRSLDVEVEKTMSRGEWLIGLSLTAASKINGRIIPNPWSGETK